ncbi:MAG: 50S ribosomal subunit protein L29 [Candidatus Westeberhardia cardiocondylae]|nr:50S ribosomal subunit protein L29 [Candidatus Westeberhardia cardiocondylae]
MNIKIIGKKNNNELNYELFRLFHKEFDLRVKYALHSKNVRHTHLFRNIRRNIAIIKMILNKR